MESTISISFPVRMTDDKTGFAYVAQDNINATAHAKSINTAKAKLKPFLQAEIDAALLQVANYRQKFIGCVNGTVLLVQFRHGCWGYEIAGPNRSHGSAVLTSGTFETCVADAQRHAATSYDGVAWEC